MLLVSYVTSSKHSIHVGRGGSSVFSVVHLLPVIVANSRLMVLRNHVALWRCRLHVVSYGQS